MSWWQRPAFLEGLPLIANREAGRLRTGISWTSRLTAYQDLSLCSYSNSLFILVIIYIIDDHYLGLIV